MTLTEKSLHWHKSRQHWQRDKFMNSTKYTYEAPSMILGGVGHYGGLLEIVVDNCMANVTMTQLLGGTYGTERKVEKASFSREMWDEYKDVITANATLVKTETL